MSSHRFFLKIGLVCRHLDRLFAAHLLVNCYYSSCCQLSEQRIMTSLRIILGVLFFLNDSSIMTVLSINLISYNN